VTRTKNDSKQTHSRMSLSQLEERAVEVGPVELMNLLEWELRKQPRALRKVRQRYVDLCVALYRGSEKCRGEL
jgi:hypothetical protein